MKCLIEFIVTHQDNVRHRNNDQTSSEVRSQVRSDSFRSIDLFGNSFESFLVFGDRVEVVADNGPQPGVDVENGLLEGERVTVHLHLPLAGSQATEEKKSVLLWKQ